MLEDLGAGLGRHRDRSTGRIVLGYVTGALAWPFISDKVLRFMRDPVLQHWLSAGKRCLFAALIASLRILRLRQAERTPQPTPSVAGSFGETFEQATIGIGHFTLALGFIRANPRLAELLGYDVAELAGKNAREIVHAENLAEFDRTREGLVRGERLAFYPAEQRYIRKDGSIVWLSVTATLVHAEPNYLVGFYQDVSERRAARVQLAASEARFRSYIEAAPVAVLIVDAVGRYVDCNPAACALLGYGRDKLETIAIADLLAPEDRDRGLQDFAQLHERGASSGEYGFTRPDGATVPVELSSVKLSEDRYMTYLLDIAPRRQAEAELRERLRLQDQMIRISDSVPGVIYAYRWRPDGSTCMPFVTSRMESVYGLKPEDVALTDAPFQERVRLEDRRRVWDLMMESARTLSPSLVEFRYLHPTKGVRWIEANALPRGEPDGGVLWFGFAADVTDRKRNEAALRDASAVLASTDEGVCIADLDGVLTSVNAAFCASTGYAEAEVVGRHVGLLRSSRHGPEFYAAQKRSLQKTGSWQGEIWHKRKNGEVYPVSLAMNTVRDESGRPVKYIGTFTDISRIKEQESKLEHLATRDTLTGLPNRGVLRHRLDQALERAGRSGNSGALLFLGLDRFKSVNESLGHQSGDEALRVLADRLKARLREGDTLARLGGDEFAVVLEQLGDADDTAVVARSLIQQILEPIPLSGGQAIVVGASIGISLFPADGEAPDELLRNADAALHQAKADGRGSYRLFSADLTRGVAERFDLEGRLRRAIERQEFVLHYQPLVSLADRSVKGVEALIRWEDPERGRILPGQFIGLAEETGLIVPLGHWVLHTACAQMQAWRAAGVFDGVIAVNLSPVQFRQHDIVDQVARVLEATGLPGSALELELTEGALIGDATASQETLADLKALGVRLAIDDFGTGYSSLAYLKRFPIDKLKIDQSFVREIPSDAADMEIAAAIISLARSLHLEALAEGIETEAQLEFLRSRGCDSGQGYLFARPMPAEDLAAFAAGRRSAA